MSIKLTREQLWFQAWCVVAGAPDCYDKEAPVKWADHCLKSYDERFIEPAKEAQKKEFNS